MDKPTPQVGDKVTSRPQAFNRCTGVVTAVIPARTDRVAGVAVYCGGYESKWLALDDVVILGKYRP